MAVVHCSVEHDSAVSMFVSLTESIGWVRRSSAIRYQFFSIDWRALVVHRSCSVSHSNEIDSFSWWQLFPHTDWNLNLIDLGQKRKEKNPHAQKWKNVQCKIQNKRWSKFIAASIVTFITAIGIAIEYANESFTFGRTHQNDQNLKKWTHHNNRCWWPGVAW